MWTVAENWTESVGLMDLPSESVSMSVAAPEMIANELAPPPGRLQAASARSSDRCDPEKLGPRMWNRARPPGFRFRTSHFSAHFRHSSRADLSRPRVGVSGTRKTASSGTTAVLPRRRLR